MHNIIFILRRIDASVCVDWRNYQELSDGAAIRGNIDVGTAWNLIDFIVLCLRLVVPNNNSQVRKALAWLMTKAITTINISRSWVKIEVTVYTLIISLSLVPYLSTFFLLYIYPINLCMQIRC